MQRFGKKIILHGVLCWLLSNSEKDFVYFLLNKGNSELLKEIKVPFIDQLDI